MTDYCTGSDCWACETRSKKAAYKYAATLGRLGVAAFPTKREDGTWHVLMTA